MMHSFPVHFWPEIKPLSDSFPCMLRDLHSHVHLAYVAHLFLDPNVHLPLAVLELEVRKNRQKNPSDVFGIEVSLKTHAPARLHKLLSKSPPYYVSLRVQSRGSSHRYEW